MLGSQCVVNSKCHTLHYTVSSLRRVGQDKVVFFFHFLTARLWLTYLFVDSSCSKAIYLLLELACVFISWKEMVYFHLVRWLNFPRQLVKNLKYIINSSCNIDRSSFLFRYVPTEIVHSLILYLEEFKRLGISGTLFSLESDIEQRSDSASSNFPDIQNIWRKNKSNKNYIVSCTIAGTKESNRGLGPLFEGINDNFTIFAPTNEAFQDLNNVSTIFANSGTLETLILYQVVPGALTTSDIVSQFEKEGVGTLNSVNNLEILVFVRPNGTILLGTDEASLVTTNLSAGNSVIQVISRVLVPPVTNFLLGPTVIPTAPSAPTSADAGVSTTSISSSLPQTTFA
ncbi:hypothetical protein Gasu2_30470 [Galdieria sulphuraria]|nr:hypothetical protein Gasu2_30470 [Galdieria sulphuraria]